MKFLTERSPGWYSGDDIAQAIGRKRGTVACNLNSLGYRGEVESERVGPGRRTLYRCAQPTAFMQFIEGL